MKILILGGMHGNEELGIELVKLLKNAPLSGVDSLIANPRAVAAKTRFTESDLNRSFGQQDPGSYECTRAQELARLCKNYDVVLDFHNTQTPNNNCLFIGPSCIAPVKRVASRLGLQRCIIATYDCINAYCNNAVSIEISKDDPKDDPQYWYDLIVLLAKDQPSVASSVKLYEFCRRVTWQESRNLQTESWVPFQKIPTSDKNNLSLNGTIVPIFVGSKLTEYYATLLREKGTL